MAVITGDDHYHPSTKDRKTDYTELKAHMQLYGSVFSGPNKKEQGDWKT